MDTLYSSGANLAALYILSETNGMRGRDAKTVRSRPVDEWGGALGRGYVKSGYVVK